MAHIHTEPGQHDFTTSAMIFRLDASGPKLLMHWHKKLQRWMHFGGHVELHEDPWQALKHEVREESGYDMSQLRLLQPPVKLLSMKLPGIKLHPYPICLITVPFPGIDHFHSDAAFAFVTNKRPKQKPAAGESTDLRAFSRQTIVELPQSEIFDNVREMALFVFDDCLGSWQQVVPHTHLPPIPVIPAKAGI